MGLTDEEWDCPTLGDTARYISTIRVFKKRKKSIVFIFCSEDRDIGGADTSVTMQYTEVE